MAQSRVKKQARLEVPDGDRYIGPYRFHFVMTVKGLAYLQIDEDGETLHESSPFRPGDTKMMKKRMLVALSVLSARLATLAEKTLMKIHEIA